MCAAAAAKPRVVASESQSSFDRLGRYRLIRPLSKGGMALVYEGRRESLAGVSPRVAIKFILPEHAASETYRELFINEARLGASMHHQNLVQILDFDADGDRWFLVMEYVEGLTLRKLIIGAQKLGDRIPLPVIAEIGRQACDGLHFAHGANDDRGRHLKLVHRDMKPSNLILSPHGMVKVLDFGISKGRLRQEKEGSVKGTWGYMAPEQAVGLPVGPTADVFGLATVLYELAALTPMFVDKSKDDIKRLLKDDHAARVAATLPSEYAPLVPVLIKALQRDPRARYASAEEFGRGLAGLLSDPVSVRDETLRFFGRANAVEGGTGAAAPANGGRKPVRDAPTAVLAPARSRSWIGRGSAIALAVGALVAVGVASWWFLPHTLAKGAAAGELATDGRPPPTEPRARTAFGQVGLGALEDTLPEVPPEPAEPAEPEEPTAVARVDRTGAQPELTLPGEPVVAEAEPTAAEVRSAMEPPPVSVDPADLASVVLGCTQDAEIYIAGRYAGRNRVEKQLPPGHYAVAMVTGDGRRRSFEIDLEKAGKLKRIWDFDRQGWR
jgi:hypothetical protein